VELQKNAGLHKEPLGIDVGRAADSFLRCKKEGIKIVDGQQLMSDARVIKTQDEISLLNHSAMMVDAAVRRIVSRDEARDERENQAVGAGEQSFCTDLGSEYVEAVNAISGERCNPHPPRFLGSRAAAGGSGLLRHFALLHGLPDLLLPGVSRSGYALARDD